MIEKIAIFICNIFKQHSSDQNRRKELYLYVLRNSVFSYLCLSGCHDYHKSYFLFLFNPTDLKQILILVLYSSQKQ